jgi:hypothetical protein
MMFIRVSASKVRTISARSLRGFRPLNNEKSMMKATMTTMKSSLSPMLPPKFIFRL